MIGDASLDPVKPRKTAVCLVVCFFICSFISLIRFWDRNTLFFQSLVNFFFIWKYVLNPIELVVVTVKFVKTHPT